MSAITSIMVGLVALTTLVPTAAPLAPPPGDDGLKLQQTVKSVRDVGIAAYAWLTEEVGDNPDLEPGRSIVASEGATIDWSKCPSISHADLVQLIVPGHIRQVPTLDAWGNPLEFCVSRENLLRNSYVIGVRSSGRDGKFDNTPFTRGGFDSSDLDHDIVWIDGYFVAWPKELTP